MIEVLKAVALLAAVGFCSFYFGFRLGRTYEFIYLKHGDNRKELDQ